MSEVRERKCDRRELGQQHRVPRTLVPNLMPWLRSAGHQHYYTRAGASQQACPAPRGSSEPPTSSRRSWTKRRSVSLCRPVCTLTLQISSDAHTHIHTHTLTICPSVPVREVRMKTRVQLWAAALCALLLLTFLHAALLGHVFFALVKWKLSREAETLFTFRFDRL